MNLFEKCFLLHENHAFLEFELGEYLFEFVAFSDNEAFVITFELNAELFNVFKIDQLCILIDLFY